MAGGRRRNVRRRVNHEEGDFLDHMMQQDGGEDMEGEYGEYEDEDGQGPSGKVGKKKAAKLAAKEEKKAMREWVNWRFFSIKNDLGSTRTRGEEEKRG